MTNLANNLIYYRKKSGLTQGQLGDLLHVSAQAISKWENGQAEPSLDIILKLAEIYHVTTDKLISSTVPEDDISEEFTATKKEEKPKKKSILRFWYVPVIALVLIGAALFFILRPENPSRYGKLIQSGEITIGMTKSEIKDLLGTPTDHANSKTTIFGAEFNYANSDYYLYYNERDAKNDTELWFGVEYAYLRLVFDKDGKLVEAYYNAEPTTEIWAYGDTEALDVASYAPILTKNGNKTDNAVITFTNGSVYLGKVTEIPSTISAHTGYKTKPSLETAIATFEITEEILNGEVDKEITASDKTQASKTCYMCEEEKSDCKNDTRVLGEDEPVPVCKDCREELDKLF